MIDGVFQSIAEFSRELLDSGHAVGTVAIGGDHQGQTAIPRQLDQSRLPDWASIETFRTAPRFPRIDMAVSRNRHSRRLAKSRILTQTQPCPANEERQGLLITLYPKF